MSSAQWPSVSMKNFWPKADGFTSPLLRSRAAGTAQPGTMPESELLPGAGSLTSPVGKTDAAAELASETAGLPTSSASPSSSGLTDSRSSLAYQTAPKPLRSARSASSAEDTAGQGKLEILSRLERATLQLSNAAAGSSLMAKHPQLFSSPAQTLLCLGMGFLALGQVTVVLSVLRWLLSVSNLATLVGIVCLVLAASSSLNRLLTMFTMQVEAIVLAIPKLPTMAEEISEMLIQIKLMRQDLQLMRSKVSWLPGGQ